MNRFSVPIFLLAFGAVLGLVSPSYADHPRSSSRGFNIAARPNGFEEVPAVLTNGNAAFLASVSQQAQTITFKLIFNDLSSDPSTATISFGQRGVNGGTVAFLCGGGSKGACPSSASGTITGTIAASDVLGVADQGVAAGSFQDLVDVIVSGNGYVNISSTNFPAGELRGQIVP